MKQPYYLSLGAEGGIKKETNEDDTNGGDGDGEPVLRCAALYDTWQGCYPASSLFRLTRAVMSLYFSSYPNSGPRVELPW